MSRAFKFIAPMFSETVILQRSSVAARLKGAKRGGVDAETVLGSKVKLSIPCTGLDRPIGVQGVEAPRYHDNRHMKVVRLSALRTGHLYPAGNIPDDHFC
jgi:hypothetical protein